MAAAGPAPRGSSLTGDRPFQYGAAANNTSSSTQRKQHWRLTALAAAAPRLAARAADAHRARALPRGLTGNVVSLWGGGGKLHVPPCAAAAVPSLPGGWSGELGSAPLVLQGLVVLLSPGFPYASKQGRRVYAEAKTE
ncbi:uncharacterized protein AAGF69_003384 isoform 1-T1 [Amazona ochrocephala]